MVAYAWILVTPLGNWIEWLIAYLAKWDATPAHPATAGCPGRQLGDCAIASSITPEFRGTRQQHFKNSLERSLIVSVSPRLQLIPLDADRLRRRRCASPEAASSMVDFPRESGEPIARAGW